MKIAIKFGLGIAVLIALVNSFFIDLLGIENNFSRNYSGYSPFILTAIGLFIAMRKTKVEVYNNEWNFGQAIYSGIIISAFAAMFLGCFNFLYFQFINLDYVDKLIPTVQPLMIQDKLTPEDISKQIEIMKETYKPINQLTGTFVFMLITGVVFSAIFSSILRTRDTFTQIINKNEIKN